ncbi:hypothetical protein ACFWBS_35030 [Streptomyces mirabilis]|uniref:hypothetical protein n=1 Tax=Streptomyces mirabilis TaxID=68239 RepID=UPI00364C6933
MVYYGARPGTGPAAAEQWTRQQADLSGAVLGQTAAERLGADIFGQLLTAPAE